MPAAENGSRQRLLSIVALGLGAAFLWLVHQRILTYVCGNDPMLYIRAARVLLAPSLYGPEAVRHALTFVAPGYPVILAVAIKLFGPLSPYWVNLCFLLATLPLIWFVLRRLMSSDRAAAFSLLGLLLIAFRSHELNAPYLLYPFRESSRVFFVYASYAGLVLGLGREGVHRGWVLGSSLALLAACAIREPSALILPGLLLGMAGLSPSWRERLRGWGWFLLPWLLAGVAGAFVLARVSLTDISQFSVVRYLGNPEVAIARGREMLGWFPARSGWLAVALMSLGVVRALWRSQILCAWFLLPGILFFVFCAYMQMHARYFLTSLLFLAVFAGYGLDGLCAALERAGDTGRRRPWVRFALSWGCLVLLSAGLYQTAGRVRVWGPRVGAAEVREWQALVSGLEPAADGRVRVAVEQRSRYLEDLLLSYTDADLLDPKKVDEWPARWAPAHYFQPLNRQAFYKTPQWLMWLKILAHRILADRMDLIPAGDGQPEIRTIGRGRYEQYLLQPWSAGSHRQGFISLPGRDQVVWLDWGTSAGDTVRTVEIRNAETGARWFSREVTGSGLQAIALSGATVDGDRAVLSVESSKPVPARPVFGVIEAVVPKEFVFDKDRRVSLNRLLSSLERGPLEDNPFYWEVGRWLTFRAPVLRADSGGVWSVCFRGRRTDQDPLSVRVRRRDGRETVRDLATGGEACFIEMEGGETIEMGLESSRLPKRGAWHIDRISFEYRPRR